MNHRKLFFKLIVLFTLPLLGLWLSLAGLARVAQAAPAPVALVESSGLALPASIPMQQGTEADLFINKTNGQTETVPGGSTTYTIMVTNLAPTTTVTGATVTDNFPAAPEACYSTIRMICFEVERELGLALYEIAPD